MVKVRLRARAFADPARSQMIFALERCRHRPADRLRELRGEIARDREQIPGPGVVHHRKLPALAHVARVREQLTHHVDQRGATNDMQTLIAVGREQHVARLERHALGDGNRFLAQRPHVEGDFSGALGTLHAVIVEAREQHVPKAHLQFLRVEVRMPRTDGFVVVVQNPHQLDRQRAQVANFGTDLRPGYRSGGGQMDVAEIGFFARPGGRFGQVQARTLVHRGTLRLRVSRVAFIRSALDNLECSFRISPNNAKFFSSEY